MKKLIIIIVLFIFSYKDKDCVTKIECNCGHIRGVYAWDSIIQVENYCSKNLKYFKLGRHEYIPVLQKYVKDTNTPYCSFDVW